MEVKAEVLRVEALTVLIVQVLLEALRQQVRLETSAEECPVFESELGEQGLSVTDIGDILHSEHINLFEIDLLDRFGLLKFVTLLLGFLLLGLTCLLPLLLLLCEQGLTLNRILELSPLSTPLLEGGLPICNCLLEGVTD